MLKETRQYVAKKPEDFKQRQLKRKHIPLLTEIDLKFEVLGKTSNFECLSLNVLVD